MRRLFPKSLAGQTILVLVLGLTVSHVVSLAIYSSDRVESLSLVSGHQVAQNFANIAHLVSEAPVAWREPIVSAVSGPTLRVTLSPQSQLTEPEPEEFQTNIIRLLVERRLHEDSVSQVIVQLVEGSELG